MYNDLDYFGVPSTSLVIWVSVSDEIAPVAMHVSFHKFVFRVYHGPVRLAVFIALHEFVVFFVYLKTGLIMLFMQAITRRDMDIKSGYGH